MINKIKNFFSGIGAGILAVLFAIGVAFLSRRDNRKFHQEQKKANDKLKKENEKMKDQTQDVVEDKNELEKQSDQIDKESEDIKEEAAETESDFQDHFNVFLIFILVPALMFATSFGVVAANDSPVPKEVTIEDLKVPEVPEDGTKDELIDLCHKLIDKYKDMGKVAIQFRSLYYRSQDNLDESQEVNNKLEGKLDEVIEINKNKDEVLAEKDKIIDELLQEDQGLDWGFYGGMGYPPLNPKNTELNFGAFFNF